MGMLTAIGVNSSLFPQLVTFVIVYLVLRYFLFGPYYAAFLERRERTVGKTEMAERFVAQAQELEQEYGIKAREVNAKYKAVYDQTRSEALKEYDRLVNEARQSAKEIVEDQRQKIQTEMTQAREKIISEVPAVSQLINQKLIGKDLSA